MRFPQYKKFSGTLATIDIPRSPIAGEECTPTSPGALNLSEFHSPARIEIANHRTVQANQAAITEQDPDQEGSITPSTFKRAVRRAAEIFPGTKKMSGFAKKPTAKNEGELSLAELLTVGEQLREHSFSAAIDSAVHPKDASKRGSAADPKRTIALEEVDKEHLRGMKATLLLPSTFLRAEK